MKRRGFFGALLAAFFPVVPATAADPWADIVWLPSGQMPDPVYPAPRMWGKVIWTSEKRSINCAAQFDGAAFYYSANEVEVP